ncbi:MAG: hypothetical protein WCQ97_06095 [Aminobacterium sp.]|jgi:hypothetical protein|uniref:Uncharacterized protein n=1 Tax=bioreactor metagenome TaxID=1076179 RepID=A0A645FUE2_9ZZZZ|nr:MULTISPECIES: hypothetical protein [unclassified Aminobacterium]MDD2206404.1 hypothetical protein [Aminobacterium sp.]MDD3425390.1 hypothetical protein [Aminobacterium sp.]MDD3707757.1 hypothetical protein [Aminobacterium sp.]MDD4228261.1 hypothetical protein [Aminobacterium sp.]MDD4551298.1 hypothetical protein [Aminobacterium sp.]
MKKKIITCLALLAVFVLGIATVGNAADFSIFEIREIAIKGHKLHIRGDVDLPEGAMLHLALHFPGFDGKPGNKKDIKVHVNKHHFFVQIRLPKGEKNVSWAGILRAFFRPSWQNEQIRKQVGAKGEHLKGPKVRFENGEKIFFDQKNFSIDI